MEKLFESCKRSFLLTQHVIKKMYKIDAWRFLTFPFDFDESLLLLGANCVVGSKIPSTDACPAGSIP
jgi:hypothetical protein